MDNLPTRNNNPGDIKDPSTGTFRQFNSPQEGYAALLNDLHSKQTGTTTTGVGPSSTLADFAKVYAPPSDKNNSAQYTANLANHMGVRPDAKLSELDLGKWADAVAHAEGYQGNTDTSNVQQNPSNTVNQTPTPEQPKEGFLHSLAKGIIEPVATIVARPFQAGAELLGASAEDVNNATKNIAGDFVAPVPQNATDVLKDVGRGAQTVALGTPVGSLKGAIGTGLLAGTGSGLEDTGTAQGALQGSLVGGGLGLAGGGVAKLLQHIPTRLVQDAFKGLNTEQAQKVLQNKTIGTASNLLNQSDKAISEYGTKLGNELKDDAYKNIKVNAENVLSKLADDPQVKQKLIDTGMSLDDIGKEVGKLAKLKGGLVEKFFNGEGLSVPDLHRLNSALGENIFKTVFDEPAVKAGKDLGNIVYHGISDYIKGVAPKTAPMFDELSKEYAIRKAITKVAKKHSGGLIRWSDIVPFMAGSGLGGLPGGLAAAAVNRVAHSPATEFGIAKGLQKSSRVLNPLLGRAGLISTYKK